MDEPRLDELMHRIDTLEHEKRRWKFIGIVSLVLLGLATAFGGVLTVGALTVARVKHSRMLDAEREAAMRERDAAEQAMRQAEMARMQAERARIQAEEAERARHSKKADPND